MNQATPLRITDAITFEQAIDLSQTLLNQIEAGQGADQTIEATVAQLVQTENGARGWFVTYLPDPRPVADPPSAAIVSALQTSPDIVSELMIKNLVMSTAMILHHRRNQDPVMAAGSERVQGRSQQLIAQLNLPQLTEKAHQMLASLQQGGGAYGAFLERWNYDSAQKQAMIQILTNLLNPSS